MCGRDAKKSQGMTSSPQKISTSSGERADRLARKHLSVILGLRELLEEFRCFATGEKKRKKKEER